jgi:hypothetical protein
LSLPDPGPRRCFHFCEQLDADLPGKSLGPDRASRVFLARLRIVYRTDSPDTISSARLRTTMGTEYSGDLHDYHTMTASFHKPSLRHPDWQDISIPGAPRQGKVRHAVQQTG